MHAATLLVCSVPLLMGTGCTHTIKSPLVDVPEPTPMPSGWTTPWVAFLGTTDLRLAKGGGQTHKEVRVPTSSGGWGSRGWGYPVDPWNRFQPMVPMEPREEIRHVATGELGAAEVAVPLEVGFARQWLSEWDRARIADASQDPLAVDPDPARAMAFLDRYPQYQAAVWLEVVRARADLPDRSALNGLLVLGSVCTLGVGALGYLVPVPLNTPVDVAVRAYAVRRNRPDIPLGTSAEERGTVEVRGSVGFDPDRLRADVARHVSGAMGARLASALSAGLKDREHGAGSPSRASRPEEAP